MTDLLTARDEEAIVRLAERTRRNWHPDSWVDAETIRMRLRTTREIAEDAPDVDVVDALEHENRRLREEIQEKDNLIEALEKERDELRSLIQRMLDTAADYEGELNEITEVATL